eukprot:Rhum_TRINITY_DN13397_c0_g1::Rhum_TRINITY_DN13397_c0_g1_i1::g.58912::m.58912
MRQLRDGAEVAPVREEDVQLPQVAARGEDCAHLVDQADQGEVLQPRCDGLQRLHEALREGVEAVGHDLRHGRLVQVLPAAQVFERLAAADAEEAEVRQVGEVEPHAAARVPQLQLLDVRAADVLAPQVRLPHLHAPHPRQPRRPRNHRGVAVRGDGGAGQGELRQALRVEAQQHLVVHLPLAPQVEHLQAAAAVGKVQKRRLAQLAVPGVPHGELAQRRAEVRRHGLQARRVHGLAVLHVQHLDAAAARRQRRQHGAEVGCPVAVQVQREQGGGEVGEEGRHRVGGRGAEVVAAGTAALEEDAHAAAGGGTGAERAVVEVAADEYQNVFAGPEACGMCCAHRERLLLLFTLPHPPLDLTPRFLLLPLQ